jgi:chromosome partitioning protein
MRTIAMINQKGGCGKTTCSINLAACLAHLGQRTLLVDMDPQGHCAVGLAVPDAQVERSIYDILRNPGGSSSLKDITWQIASNFDLVPSNISLAALENELHDQPGRQDRLADALGRVANDYDYCVIDCPPNVGLLTFNAMRACSDVVIPVETGYFSLHGLTKQLELLDALRKQCQQEIRIRILATLYDIRTKLAREVLAELREQYSELLMEAAINFNTKLKEAASFGQPITEYDPASKGFKDFAKLAQELMGPAPRLRLDLTKYLSVGDEAAERAMQTVRGAGAVAPEEEAIPNGIELPEPEPQRVRITEIQPRDVRLTADDMARRAQEIKASAQRDLGITISAESAKASVESKLEEFYGVKQLPEGVLFVTRQPGAQAVAVAGDFNDWQPEKTRMLNHGDPGTFRAIVPLTPGRYRYRLVVDGNWLADPHNVYTEPNGFGGVNSVVEVV